MMSWTKLLSPKRTLELMTGEPPRLPKRQDDTRTEFERDYDRAVFCTPVRRLQDKAQVFPLEPIDYVRTRLTHSLEVSAVARSLGQGIAAGLVERKDVSSSQARDIETIAATCGLVHDLGNPPFGHAGEDAMKAWFRDRLEKPRKDGKTLQEMLGGGRSEPAQDFLNFDGNPQTLRLIVHLQMLADRFGLNLTTGTLSAACKYTASSLEVNGNSKRHDHTKLGYFNSEREIVARVREETGTGSLRNPLAFVVEAADDIVYATVDLEDGIRKGVIDWGTLKSQLEGILGQTHPLLRSMLDGSEDYVQKGGLALTGSALDEAHSQIFRAKVIGEHVAAARQVFESRYSEIMAGAFQGELMKEAGTKTLLAACKTLGRSHVYNSKETLKLEIMGRHVIHDLMSMFWEGAQAAPDGAKEFKSSFPGKIYDLFSSNYRMLFELDAAVAKSQSELDYARLQLVADYVAGMTDTFAVKLHKELRNG